MNDAVEETKRRIAVMQAWLDGKPIQFRGCVGSIPARGTIFRTKSMNKVQRYVVIDSTGKDHDVVAHHAVATFDHGTLLVQFRASNTQEVAVFLNPICYSTYETEN